MWQYIVKIGITALIVVAISEIVKRSSFWAAALASLPLTSLLAFIWLYLESADSERVASLSTRIFWLVIPSLPLFLLLPALIRAGVGFWISLVVSCVATASLYFAMVWALGKFGVKV